MQKQTYIFHERKNDKRRKTPSDYMNNSGSEKRLSKYTAIWYIFPQIYILFKICVIKIIYIYL